jgi:hypothetical protein
MSTKTRRGDERKSATRLKAETSETATVPAVSATMRRLATLMFAVAEGSITFGEEPTAAGVAWLESFALESEQRSEFNALRVAQWAAAWLRAPEATESELLESFREIQHEQTEVSQLLSVRADGALVTSLRERGEDTETIKRMAAAIAELSARIPPIRIAGGIR